MKLIKGIIMLSLLTLLLVAVFVSLDAAILTIGFYLFYTYTKYSISIFIILMMVIGLPVSIFLYTILEQLVKNLWRYGMKDVNRSRKVIPSLDDLILNDLNEFTNYKAIEK